MNSLPMNIFRAYILGGRLWPQKRWSITVFQLDALANVEPWNPFNERSLNAFYMQRPSINQMHIIRKIMDEDHRQAGLTYLVIDDERIRNDYEKSIVALHSTVNAWAHDCACSNIGELSLTQRREYAHRISLVVQACADGGTNVLWQFSCKKNMPYIPDFISGDMDSITDESRSYYSRFNVPIILTSDQAETDFTKCVKLMIERFSPNKLDFIYVFSTLGGRFDQSMGLINTLHLHRDTIALYLISDKDITFLLRPGFNYLHIKSNLLGEYCSLLPFSGSTRAVTHHLKWNITIDTELNFYSLISSSNTYDDQWLQDCNTDYVDILVENYLIWSMTYIAKVNQVNNVINSS
ncbi:unnamed protein product [Rotaria sp. Silwood2]|nr:unnamed protein product [Rotaria sp. Silwood2]CAF2995888.1 unnamed protein product [Rotaria sp. Silwood2]CAF3283856.1 unnamed protein product [Rotaria sp. Silwood2]CAF4074204.1 unnamed protein product [Rotaria sp. Silwood2]CAF4091205.1 unnamed protein product [Rotaria sp. Silwood2]